MPLKDGALLLIAVQQCELTTKTLYFSDSPFPSLISWVCLFDLAEKVENT